MKNNNNKLSASMEDYLEAIFQIIKDKGAARPKDISNILGVKNSSITEALIALSKKKLINYAPYELISLTPTGKSIAGKVAKRHDTIHRFFTKVLLIDEKESQEAACKVEHVIGQNILTRLEEFIKFTQTCPRSSSRWLKKFLSSETSEINTDSCTYCLKISLNNLNNHNFKEHEKEV
jgi:DtxR family transcriptional regulator, Mn-dependent transcriptional regulator